MMKRKTLLSILTILIVLIAIYTYANSRQDQHQDEEHHTHHVSRPMELHSVMRLLMLDLHTINEGIFTQNFDLIASGAASIVDQDRRSTRLNSSHVAISYAVFCLKKKSTYEEQTP